jgi:hypothetical protein
MILLLKKGDEMPQTHSGLGFPDDYVYAMSQQRY